MKTRKRRKSENKNKGRFSRKCGCLNHSENDSLLHNVKWKVIKKQTLKRLQAQKLLPTSNKYICQFCLEKYGGQDFTPLKKKMSFDPQNIKDQAGSSGSATDEFDLNALTATADLSDVSSSIQMDQLLAHQHAIKEAISKDIAKLRKQQPCGSLDKVLEYSPESWLKDRPEELVSFLATICGFSVKKKRDVMLLCKCIEQLYGARSKVLVLPLHFRENLVSYSIYNSKTICNINNQSSPSGSYSFISKWLTEQGKKEITFPQGTVRVVFDNEQVVGKRYTICFDNSVPSSIVTSHAYLVCNENDVLQCGKTLSPADWMFKALTENQIDGVSQHHKKHQQFFRDSRNKFIETRLAVLSREQEAETSNENEQTVFQDSVDMFLTEKRRLNETKFCAVCGGANDPSYRVCTNCKGNLIQKEFEFSSTMTSNSSNSTDPYISFESSPKRNNVAVQVGEPDLINPNGYHNIAIILKNLGKRAGIQKYNVQSGSRQWLYLENDGAIYTIVIKLIENVFYCELCGESSYGECNFKEHTCCLLQNVTPSREFDWIVPTPGLLHLEMNCGKAFMSLNWCVFMEEILESCFGFVSEKAKLYAKKCSDHHKLWEILELVYLAFADELLLPYFRHCKATESDATAHGYWMFSTDAKNPNYVYIQQMVFTYLHAFMMLRKGVRNGDSQLVLVAKTKLGSLFFGRNHPHYRDIIYNDFKLAYLMPFPVAEGFYSSISASRIGRVGHYQSGDALLEEINKAAKKWVLGVPNDAQWLQSFRNLDKLTEVI